VSGVVSPSEQDQSPPRAAPIDDFELDIILDSNELDVVGHPITAPGGFLCCALQVKRERRPLSQGSFERTFILVQDALVGGANSVKGNLQSRAIKDYRTGEDGVGAVVGGDFGSRPAAVSDLRKGDNYSTLSIPELERALPVSINILPEQKARE